MKIRYIIQESSGLDITRARYVSAPPGFYRDIASPAKLVRDCCDPNTSGPEWTEKYSRAHQFLTERAAKRVANKCPSAQIVRVEVFTKRERASA